jgi:hypothetical protein
MTRATRSLFSFGIAAALALVMSPVALAGPAEPVKFGDRQLQIPAPEGFVPVSRELPDYMQAVQGFLPPANRLVEAYLAPDDKAAMAAGQQRNLAHYFQLQTMRSVDGQPISSSDFSEAMGQVEQQIATMMPKMDAEAAKLSAQGTEALQNQTGGDTQLEIGGVQYLGIYRREPWGLFFTTSMGVKVTEGDAAQAMRLYSASALVLVDHQLLYQYAYADANDPQARAWAERSVSAWADATRAANPDDPGVESQAKQLSGGFDWSRVVKRGLLFGLIGALAALVAGWMRRRKSN